MEVLACSAVEEVVGHEGYAEREVATKIVRSATLKIRKLSKK